MAPPGQPWRLVFEPDHRKTRVSIATWEGGSPILYAGVEPGVTAVAVVLVQPTDRPDVEVRGWRLRAENVARLRQLQLERGQDLLVSRRGIFVAPDAVLTGHDDLRRHALDLMRGATQLRL